MRLFIRWWISLFWSFSAIFFFENTKVASDWYIGKIIEILSFLNDFIVLWPIISTGQNKWTVGHTFRVSINFCSYKTLHFAAQQNKWISVENFVSISNKINIKKKKKQTLVAFNSSFCLHRLLTTDTISYIK